MNELEAVAKSPLEVVIDLRQTVGIENTAKIIRTFGGTGIYIPLMETITKNQRNENIYREFINGTSIRNLSRKYAVTEIAIRKILNSKKELRRTEQADITRK